VVVAPVGYRPRKGSKLLHRQPALAVARYEILLLAEARAFGSDATRGTLPPPKWQMDQPKQRLSVQELIRQLRREVWANAIDQLDANSDGFVIPVPTDMKPLK